MFEIKPFGNIIYISGIIPNIIKILLDIIKIKQIFKLIRQLYLEN